MTAANPRHWSDDLFDDFFRDIAQRFQRVVAFRPRMDLAETDRDLTVTVQLPGVAREHVRVVIYGNEVRVRGEVPRGGRRIGCGSPAAGNPVRRVRT